jgi:hypothetical protein
MAPGPGRLDCRQPSGRIAAQLTIQSLQKQRLLAGTLGCGQGSQGDPGASVCLGRRLLHQADLGPVQGRHGRGIQTAQGGRPPTARDPQNDSDNSRQGTEGLGVHGLNFYVAPDGP